jgi:hypothetical protein
VAFDTLAVVGGFEINGCRFDMTGPTGRVAVLFQFAFIQDIFTVLVIVVAIKAFVGLHVEFMEEHDARARAFQAILSILDKNFFGLWEYIGLGDDNNKQHRCRAKN